MQDSVIEFASYLPSNTSLVDVDEYLKHHILSLLSCVDNGLFSSAYSHLHLLYMTYVYVQLLRIAKENNEKFEYCWIGFPNQEKEFLKKPTNPFSFSGVNEKSVFRFFRLIGVDDQTIGHISSPVNTRNNRLHASGNLFCDTPEEFEIEMKEYVNRIERIEALQLAFLSSIYDRQIKSYDPDFTMTSDELNENLIAQYMLSNFQLIELAHGKVDIISDFVNTRYE